MANPTTSSVTQAPQWDEDALYSLICDPVRRRILGLLAAGKPMLAEELNPYVKGKMDRTRKHLEKLRAAGIVAMTTRDHTDGRRWLYHLTASIRVTATDTGKALDFGCCVLRV